MNTKACVFCDIAQGTAPAHIIWEDHNYVAFLSLFPNTEGATIVIPRAHYESYLFSPEVPTEVVIGIMFASRKAARILDNAFEDVGRTAVIVEGFGVNHLHTKLFPLHGTPKTWASFSSTYRKYFDKYEGYVSSHSSDKADDETLRRIRNKILSGKKTRS